jgi:hypothetical protein
MDTLIRPNSSWQAVHGTRTAVPGTSHLPLSRLAICLDCEECFGLGPERCPACGSETWTLLARFLQRFDPEHDTRRALPRSSPLTHRGAVLA